MNVTLGAALAGLLLSAATAGAQPALPASQSAKAQNTIVVEGLRLRTIADDFVERVLPTAKGSQFGRFEDPICPLIIGVDAKTKAEVAARMAEVGKAVKIEVKQQPCAPNLFVMIMPTKKDAVDGLKWSRPEYLAGVSDSYLEAAVASPKPYMAWQMLELYTADGMPIVRSNNMPTGSNGAQLTQGNTPMGDAYSEPNSTRVRTTLPPSRLRAMVKPHVMSSVVIIEKGALRNLDTRQLADFAFMQAMVPIDYRDDSPPTSSILSIFSTIPVSDAAPQSVTYADVAFLKALRAVRSDTYSSTQKNEIRGQMISELERAKER